MAYFVAEGVSIDVDAIRANADTLSNRTTLIFQQAGSFYLRIDKPLIGERLGLLSDVSLVNFGDGSGVIDNASLLGGLQLFQVYQLADGKHGLRSTTLSDAASLDQVLQNQFPGYFNNSSFHTLTVTPGQSSAGNLPEFYVEVSGGPNDYFEQVYGIPPADEGRVLVTRGEISGQRDLAWGNWLDTIGSSGPQEPPPEEPPSDIDAAAAQMVDALAQKQIDIEAAEQEIVKKQTQLILIKEQLSDQKEHLESLNELEYLQMLTLGLQATELVGSIASLFVPAKITTILQAVYGAASLAKGALDVDKASRKAFGDPSFENIQKIDENLTSYLLDAIRYEGAVRNWFDGVRLARDGAEFYRSAQNFARDNDAVKTNIEATLRNIQNLEARERELEQRLIEIRTENIQRSKELIDVSTTPNTLEMSTVDAKAVFGFGAGNAFVVDPAADGKSVNFSFQDDNQSATVGAGSSVLNGMESVLDRAVLQGSRSSYTEAQASSSDMHLEGNGASVYLFGVDRIQFSDGILATDVEAGENAGQAYRIYQASFARTPDLGGLKFWMEHIDTGQTLHAVSQGFVGSAEFQAVYGSNVSNMDFVQRLYQNVLGREGEDSGLNFWLDELGSGRRDKASVLAGFSESVENIALVGAQIENGIWLSSY